MIVFVEPLNGDYLDIIYSVSVNCQ